MGQCPRVYGSSRLNMLSGNGVGNPYIFIYQRFFFQNLHCRVVCSTTIIFSIFCIIGKQVFFKCIRTNTYLKFFKLGKIEKYVFIFIHFR